MQNIFKLLFVPVFISRESWLSTKFYTRALVGLGAVAALATSSCQTERDYRGNPFEGLSIATKKVESKERLAHVGRNYGKSFQKGGPNNEGTPYFLEAIAGTSDATFEQPQDRVKVRPDIWRRPLTNNATSTPPFTLGIALDAFNTINKPEEPQWGYLSLGNRLWRRVSESDNALSLLRHETRGEFGYDNILHKYNLEDRPGLGRFNNVGFHSEDEYAAEEERLAMKAVAKAAKHWLWDHSPALRRVDRFAGDVANSANPLGLFGGDPSARFRLSRTRFGVGLGNVWQFSGFNLETKVVVETDINESSARGSEVIFQGKIDF